MDTNTLKATALQQERNVITAMEPAIIQLSAGTQDTPKTAITGPSAGPATEDPQDTDKPVVPPADTGSPTTEALVIVLPTHADHPTAQDDTGKAPHQDFTRSVTLHPIHIHAKKVNLSLM